MLARSNPACEFGQRSKQLTLKSNDVEQNFTRLMAECSALTKQLDSLNTEVQKVTYNQRAVEHGVSRNSAVKEFHANLERIKLSIEMAEAEFNVLKKRFDAYNAVEVKAPWWKFGWGKPDQDKVFLKRDAVLGLIGLKTVASEKVKQLRRHKATIEKDLNDAKQGITEGVKDRINERLDEKKKALIEAIKALRDKVEGTAHDIKNAIEKVGVQRKQYLDAQSRDLSEAMETLEQAIRKIDRETRSRLQETL